MTTRNILTAEDGGAGGRLVIPMRTSSDALHYEHAGEAEAVLDGLWRIEDVAPKQGVMVVYGHTGTLKTFFTMGLSAAVASGTEWNGHYVDRGLVLYLIAEGQVGFRNRLVAMRNAGRYASSDPFVYLPTALDLQAPDGETRALIETVRDAAAREAAAPAVVVIDTLSKTFGAGKENSDDMAGYVANAQLIATTFECLVIIVHHRPKDSESRDLRGHSSLRAGVDTAILIEGEEVRTATVVKQKDGEEGLRWRFVLDPVVLGHSSRGKEVTTGLLRFIGDGHGSAELDAVAAATADNALFLACLRERNEQGRAVSERPSVSYAPAVFATMAESKKIGRDRLAQAMDRLFRIRAIERAELWRGPDRKPVYGLRETAGNAGDRAGDARAGSIQTQPEGAENSHFGSAGDAAGDTVRETRETFDKSLNSLAGDCGQHTPSPYGRVGPSRLGPDGPVNDWDDLDPFGGDL